MEAVSDVPQIISIQTETDPFFLMENLGSFLLGRSHKFFYDLDINSSSNFVNEHPIPYLFLVSLSIHRTYNCLSPQFFSFFLPSL